MTHISYVILPFFLLFLLEISFISECRSQEQVIEENPELLSKKQTVYLHAGPAKTGTTHVQSFVHYNRHKIEEENLCWPAEGKTHSDVKTFDGLATRFGSPNPDLSSYTPRIEKCINRNMNILISGECFGSMSKSSLQRVKDYFHHLMNNRPYDMKVIITYREWLQLSMSGYAQAIKQHGKVGNKNNFMDLMIFSKDDYYSFPAVVERWIGVFGRENVIVIDYYGLEGSHTDITYAILCEIAKVYCNEKFKTLEKGPADDNEKLDPIYTNFIFALDLFLNTHHMKQCTVEGAYERDYVKYLTEKKIKFPKLHTNLKLFLNDRFRLNAEMYEKYSDIMLHPNQTYNQQKIGDQQYDELDINALFQSAEWEEFMISEKARLLKAGKLCDLKTGNVVHEESFVGYRNGTMVTA
jgi:hypothetical protein